MALMNRAAAKVENQKAGPTFKRPTIPVSPKMKDVVDRVVAAGMKIMFAPEMADERNQAVSSNEPVSQALAKNVVGLTLILDQKSQGGIPMEAIFPAAMELLSEVGELFVKAGKPVTQDDYNDAARLMYIMIGKKLGASDDELMNGAKQAVSAGAGEQDPGAEEQPGGPEEPGEAAENETASFENKEEQMPPGMEDQP